MTGRGWRHWALIAIGVASIATGAAQAVAPAAMLALLDSEVTPASAHFFAIVGMFMVLFGGMLVHALWRGSGQRVVLLWAGLQKFGASVAVALGVMNGVFSSLALLVAAFDFLSGALILWHRSSTRPS